MQKRVCRVKHWKGQFIIIWCYWRFNNYVAFYELQEFKDGEKPQNKHHKRRRNKRHALFHS